MKIQKILVGVLSCLLVCESSLGRVPSTINTCQRCMSHNSRRGTNELKACHLFTLRNNIQTALTHTLEWGIFHATEYDKDMEHAYEVYNELNNISSLSTEFGSIDTFMVWLYISLQQITLALSKIEHFEQDEHNSRVKHNIYSLLCDVQYVVMLGAYQNNRTFRASDCIVRDDTLSESGSRYEMHDIPVQNFIMNTIAGTKFDLEFVIRVINHMLLIDV